MKIIITILILFAVSLHSQEDDSSRVKVVFLTQDVADGYDHAGCTPEMLENVEQYFIEHYKSNYIKYDITKLMENNVGPFYIFNKKYCIPIEKLLGSNTFVMTRLELIERGERFCYDDLYKVRIKIYSSLSNKSEIIYENQKVKSDTLNSIFVNKEDLIINKIFKVAQGN